MSDPRNPVVGFYQSSTGKKLDFVTVAEGARSSKIRYSFISDAPQGLIWLKWMSRTGLVKFEGLYDHEKTMWTEQSGELEDEVYILFTDENGFTWESNPVGFIQYSTAGYE